MSADTGLDHGRRIKARRIAEAIRNLGGGAHEARQLNDSDWLNADNVSRKTAKMRLTDKPPSDVTRALVIEYLEGVPRVGINEREGVRQLYEMLVADDPRDEDIPNR